MNADLRRINHCTSFTAQLNDPAPDGYHWVTFTASDACDYCQRGIYVGHDHPECCDAVLVPTSSGPQY